jgi:hypothetical protein
MAGPTEGYLKTGDARAELRYAKAAHRPDRFDPSKQVLSVLLSDAPLPSRALFDGLYLYAYKHARNIQVVEFDFTPDGVKWFFDPKGAPGSMSMSRSPNPFPYEVSGNVIQGKIEGKSEPNTQSDRSYEISATYSAEVEKPVAPPVPTAADAVAAQNSVGAKAYVDSVDAIQKGDKVRMLTHLPPEERAMLEQADFAQVLAMMQMEQPKNLKVLKAVDTATDSELSLSGMVEGKPQKGTVEMHLDGGHWFVRLEVWNEH